VNEHADSSPAVSQRAPWQPLSAVDRRVLGALVEKAKTTPDNYPLSLNALCNACNQKSNRQPVMNLEPADVQESLERLRKLGAVGFVSGYGRVEKYRHYAYQWLGVEKAELAVMAELLLRGPQTLGELRARVSRMQPLRNLDELLPIVASLKAKGLVIPLTPEGRGHVVTHALYPPAELQRVRSRFSAAGPGGRQPEAHHATAPAEDESRVLPEPPPSAAATTSGRDAETPAACTTRQAHTSEGLSQEQWNRLHSEVGALRAELEQLRSLVEQVRDQLARLLDELGT